MADGAGYAVAICIHERLLTNALLASYSNGQFPAAISTSLPGQPVVALDLFVAPPVAHCNADGTMTLVAEVWGTLLFVESATGTADQRSIDGRLTIRFAPTFEIVAVDQQPVLRFLPDPNGISVTGWEFTVLSGGPFPPDPDQYLRGPFFRDRLTQLVQLAVSTRQIALPDIPVAFLGPLAAKLDRNAEARVLEGALLLGLNAHSGDVVIVGSRGLLSDFGGTNDLAAIVDARAIPLLLGDAVQKARDQAAASGATLDSLVAVPADGRIDVSGSGSKDGGTAHFSFSVLPVMNAFKPGALFTYLKKDMLVKPRQWPALGFVLSNLQVDVEVPLWAELAGAVLFLLINPVALYLQDLINAGAAELGAQIEASPLPAPIPKVARTPPAVPGGATVRTALVSFEITSGGIAAGILFGLEAAKAQVGGPASIPQDLRGSMLTYRVTLPLGVRLDDPALRIRWSVIDLQSGQVLLNQDGPADGRAVFSFSPEAVAPAGANRLGVGCRVFRPLGAAVTEVLNDGVDLEIRGPLPPEAYVRWSYDVKNNTTQFDDQGNAWVYTGEKLFKRHSRLHRSGKDLPACNNAAKRSRYFYELEFLDQLPFPVGEIDLHRGELCDYCFYGGPGHTRPLL
jgi:hypothetical protein